MENKDVEKLADLARIDIGKEESKGLLKDLSSILEYVSELQDVNTEPQSKSNEVGSLYNVMRNDENVHESGVYTEDILSEMPEREGDYLKVKKIL